MFDTLIDDRITHLGETINVRFAGAEIATLDRIVEKPVNAVAVVRVIFRGVNSPLGRNAVRPPRTVLVTERFNLVALLGEGRGSRATSQPGADDDDLEAAAIVRRDQLGIVLMPAPLLREGAMRDLGIECADHEWVRNFTQPRRTAAGMEL